MMIPRTITLDPSPRTRTWGTLTKPPAPGEVPRDIDNSLRYSSEWRESSGVKPEEAPRKISETQRRGANVGTGER